MSRRGAVRVGPIALLSLACWAVAGGVAAQTPPADPTPADPVDEELREELAPEAEPGETEEGVAGATLPAPREGAVTGTELPPAEVLPAENITFNIPFPEERGGGTLTGYAGSIEYLREDSVRLSGGIDLRYLDLRIQAQTLDADLTTKRVVASGEVILDQGPRRITGDTLEFGLDSKTGRLTNAVAYVDPDFFFSGEEISKTGENTYEMVRGTLTACTELVPDWSFRARRATVTVDGFARIRGTSMRVKKAPIFYLPYMLWPAKSDRTSGLLFPNFGYSQRRGEYLGLAYYQVLGDSYDATLYLDLYTEDFLGAGTEFRYVPSETTRGWLEGYAIQDPLADNEWRWRADWSHTSERLPMGFRGVVRYTDVSDFDFFRDFEREFNNVTLRSLYSTAFLTKNWGANSLNILVDDRRTLFGREVRLRQLPEVEYRLRPTKLGPTLLYFDVQSSLHFLDVERSETLTGSYGRADIRPQLTLPLRVAPWLSVSLSAGGRATWWGDSLAEGGREFSGETLTRVLPLANAEIVGPSFSRIFDKGLGPFGKFKHIIEPRWTYRFVDAFEDEDLTPLFDEVDRVTGRNVGSFTLVHRLLAKPETDLFGGETREILSWELGQAYSFDELQPLQRSRDRTVSSQEGPIVSRLRFNPSKNVSFESRVDYSTLFSDLASTSISGSYGWDGNSLGMTWFTRYDPETGESSSDQVRFNSTFAVVPQRLQFDAMLNYDLERGEFQQQRYILSYNSDCWGVRLEGRELQLRTLTDRDYRFSVSLKNVGTFIDLNGGSDRRR